MCLSFAQIFKPYDAQFFSFLISDMRHCYNTLGAVGGVPQWLGCQSLAGGLSLPFIVFSLIPLMCLN